MSASYEYVSVKNCLKRRKSLAVKITWTRSLKRILKSNRFLGHPEQAKLFWFMTISQKAANRVIKSEIILLFQESCNLCVIAFCGYHYLPKVTLVTVRLFSALILNQDSGVPKSVSTPFGRPKSHLDLLLTGILLLPQNGRPFIEPQNLF